MRKLDRDLLFDFFTLAIAVVSQSLLIAAFATMLKPENTDRVFKELLNYSFLSIAGFYCLFQAAKYLFSCKVAVPDWSSGAVWFLSIAAGTFLFTCLAFDGFFFGHIEPYFGCLAAALIPALMFRLPVIFAVSFRKERKGRGTPVSFIR